VSRRRTLAIAGGLALAVLLTRAPFLGRDQPGLVWTIDEIEMSLTTLDRWLGVPHTGEHWSGASLQLALEPVVAGSFLIDRTPTIDGLIDWLSRQYRSPWHIVWLARVLVALVSSLGLASLVTAGRRSSTAVAIAVALLIATVPEVWSETLMATPGGFAVGWLALAIAIAASRASDGAALAAGVCMGIAVAARTTAAPATLFVCAIAASDAAPHRVRRALLAAIAAIVSFIVLCPYVWIEPLRFLKATLGAIVQSGSRSGVIAAGRMAIDATTPWLVVAMLAAAVVAIRRRAFVLVGGAGLTIAVMLAAAARGPNLVPRYFVAMPVVAGGFVLLTAGPEIASWLRRQRPSIGIAAVIVVAVVLGTNAWRFGRTREHMLTVAQRALATGRYLRAMVGADATLAIPDSLDVYVADRLSADATRRLAEGAASAVSAAGVVDVLAMKYGLARATAEALTDDFNEDERAAAARWRIRAVTAPVRGLNAVLHGEAAHARRFGFLSTEDAIAQFNAGGLDVLVLEGMTLPGRTPAFVAGDYQVYRR